MVFATFDGNNSDQLELAELLTPSMINNSGLPEKLSAVINSC